MGRILAAWDTRLGRRVAIKELLPGSDDLKRRFEREAFTTARLQHPAIVNVYEAGRWPSGEPFYAMKLVEGEPLDRVIDRAQTLDARLALLPNLITVAEALAYAHGKRVIHRDLKPANVLVGAFGETVVIDWGLAKDLSTTDAGESDSPPVASDRDGALTMLGSVLGTPAYMSREQARGLPVDERTDVYALGAMLYHALSGEKPYTGKSSAEVLKQVLEGLPVPLEERQPGLPEDLLALVRKAMALQPDQRYPTAKALAEDLRRFQTGQLVGAHRYSMGQLVRRWIARHRAVVSVATAALVILAAAGTIAVQRVVRERSIAEARSDELVLANARNALKDDPTTALAWLKQYSQEAPHWSAARVIASDARSQGFAARVLQGHEHAVNDIDFSPDGRWLASASSDQTLRLWDLTNGSSRVVGTFDWFVDTARFSPDGRYLAAATILDLWLFDLHAGSKKSFSNRYPKKFASTELAFSHGSLLASVGNIEDEDMRVVLRLVDLKSGGVRLIEGRGAPRRLGIEKDGGRFRVSFSPDGRFVAARLDERTIRTWEIATETVHDLDGGRGLAFAPTGSLLATGARSDKDIRVVDLTSRREQILSGHASTISDLAFSKSGSLASASVDGSIRLWNLATSRSHVREGRPGEAERLWHSPDGRWVASHGEDGTLRLWNHETGDARALHGHDGAIYSVAFATDGHQVASAGLDGSIRLWRVEAEDMRTLQHPGEHPAMSWRGTFQAFSPDGSLFAAAMEGGSIRLWKLETGDSSSLVGHAKSVTGLAFSPDGAVLASGSEDTTVRVWRLQSGKVSILRGHKEVVGSVAFSPDGRQIASGGDDVRLWDLATGASRVLRGHLFNVDMVRFSSDGRMLGSAAHPVRADSGVKDPALIVWEMAGGTSRSYEGHDDTVCGMDFSPDGRTAASASMDKTIRLWDLASGRSRLFEGHASIVFSVAFSPDGRTLGSAGNDTTVRLWDTRTGGSRALRGHREDVVDLQFSKDGMTLLTRGQTRMRVWDVATGESHALPGQASALAISPDGTYFAITGEDGQLRLWRNDLPREPVALRSWLEKATNMTVEVSPSRQPATP
jgi:WD40 repeat protein